VVVEEGGAGLGVGDHRTSQAAGRRCGRGVRTCRARPLRAHARKSDCVCNKWDLCGHIAMMPVFKKGGHVAFEELLRWTGVLHLE
jgi:hypothetical protein